MTSPPETRSAPAPCPFGAQFQPYWEQRYDLFSRFDEGIAIDGPGLFGVKYEQASLELARRLPGAHVLDAFAGWGGSAIAFARAGRRVTTADVDPDRLASARHNARVYGVEPAIEFVCDDVRSVLERRRFDVVYLDPPWGGLPALERERFRLADYALPGADLLGRALAAAPVVVLTTPPHFELGDLLPLARAFEVRPVWHAGELQYLDVVFGACVAVATGAGAGPAAA